MKHVDLNVDVGEGFPDDAALLTVATSASVCCGAHAGSEELSRQTVELCKSLGIRFGAHPGIPDRKAMGRGPLPVLNRETSKALFDSVLQQTTLLATLGAEYVKPHGELYNASSDREDVATVLVSLLRQTRLPLMGLHGTLHAAAATMAGVPFIREGFVDRAYDGRGRLVPRSVEGAVITDTKSVVSNALAMADRVESLCVHGDTPGCVDIARSVRDALREEGFEVRP